MRVLNVGGFANADVMLIERPVGERLIVKDWGDRSWPVRTFLAPLLARHEHAMLRRVEGLPGLPAPAGRVGRLALGLEFIDGQPLRGRMLGAALPPAFFAALEGILDGLEQRGVIHLDLASPKNVLATTSGAPALIDLGGATGLPLPRAFVRHLEGRAMRKLVRRFQGQRAAPHSATERDLDGYELDLGHARYRLREAGPLSDPCPLLVLPDAGLSGLAFWPLLQRAQAAGRRVIAVDLPGFGGSRALRTRPTPERLAWGVRRLMVAMRIERSQLLGQGLGGLVARSAAGRRVSGVATIDTPRDRLEEPFLSRWREGRSDGEALRVRLQAELSPSLTDPARAALLRDIGRVPARRLLAAWRAVPVRDREGQPVLAAAGAPAQLELGSAAGDPLADPEGLLKALGDL